MLPSPQFSIMSAHKPMHHLLRRNKTHCDDLHKGKELCLIVCDLLDFFVLETNSLSQTILSESMWHVGHVIVIHCTLERKPRSTTGKTSWFLCTVKSFCLNVCDMWVNDSDSLHFIREISCYHCSWFLCTVRSLCLNVCDMWVTTDCMPQCVSARVLRVSSVTIFLLFSFS